MSNKFVVAKENIQSVNNLIRKDEIGIVENTSGNTSRVFFIGAWEHVDISVNHITEVNIKETGDNYNKKICNVCHRLLDTNLFDKNQNGKNNRTVRRPSCKECRKNIDGINMTAKTRNKWKETKPQGVPFECPICHKKTIAGVTSKIVLDHDHGTGLARAWICDSCNTGIGRFKDDVELLINALDYLKSNHKL